MSFENEFQYFIDHQSELVAEYKGKVVAIKDQKILGAYDSEIEAIKNLSATHEYGSYLLQLCEPGPDVYTCVFHSRVRLPGVIEF